MRQHMLSRATYRMMAPLCSTSCMVPVHGASSSSIRLYEMPSWPFDA
jgi:hypothetical protein